MLSFELLKIFKASKFRGFEIEIFTNSRKFETQYF